MTSSRLAPYPMPAAASLPVDGPSWSIDPRRSAILVQHVQNYLLRSLRDSAPTGQLLANVGRLTRCAWSTGVPIVYAVRVPGQPAGGAGHVLLEPPAEAEPRAVADVVEPQAGDIVLAAKRYSALVGTRLRARLKEPGRDQLVVVGAAARTEVLLTAADAWMQDLEPFVAR
ncbi:isochorismatase family protein [Streptomyces sp. NPDC058274]|uniref:isochorismatase family protein n=1 Tax=Streptomyces sp. NPDC058274 TaxID=3346416 RepID=UPI0036E1578F